MSKYHVGAVDENEFAVPVDYAAHSKGYRRLPLVDHTISPASVHMGVALVEIAPGGYHEAVIHAFEKAFYVLGGEVVLDFHGRAHRLSIGHYGVISKAIQYTLSNPGREPVRIFEMNAPQPKPLDHGFKDTIFQAGDIAKDAAAPDLDDPRIKFLGRLDESQMASNGGFISAVGARSTSIRGIILKELVDRMLGARHLSLFMVQFQPGGAGTTHDHPHEEIYFLLSGKARATLEGKEFIVGPGQFVWTSVGCFHQFECLGDAPVRWIETQAPLPADFEAFRFRREWDPLSASSRPRPA